MELELELILLELELLELELILLQICEIGIGIFRKKTELELKWKNGIEPKPDNYKPVGRGWGIVCTLLFKQTAVFCDNTWQAGIDCYDNIAL